MLPHTCTPNAKLRFEPISVPVPTSRNAPTASAYFTDYADPSPFERPVYIRPVSFNDSRARAILPNSVDFSSGQVWAGDWRDELGQTLPDWVSDGHECSLAFADGKGMSAVFWRIPGRTEWANEQRLGPTFVLQVKRNG